MSDYTHDDAMRDLGRIRLGTIHDDSVFGGRDLLDENADRLAAYTERLEADYRDLQGTYDDLAADYKRLGAEARWLADALEAAGVHVTVGPRMMAQRHTDEWLQAAQEAVRHE